MRITSRKCGSAGAPAYDIFSAKSDPEKTVSGSAMILANFREMFFWILNIRRILLNQNSRGFQNDNLGVFAKNFRLC